MTDQSFAITDLGTFNSGDESFQNTLGGSGSFAQGINNYAQVVGTSHTDTGPIHAFLWDLRNLLQDLLPDSLLSSAWGINDSGQAVGALDTASGSDAFLWDNVNGLQDLGTLGGPRSSAHDINGAGQVVGVSTTDYSTTDYQRSLQGFARAFLWDNVNGLQDLGTLGGDASAAYAINDSGYVVGDSDTANGDRHAFLWSSKGGLYDLGTLGGDLSSAYGINSGGWVVGNAVIGNGEWHAFVWTSEGMQDLGTLPGGDYSLATGITSDGVVVGYSKTQSEIPITDWITRSCGTAQAVYSISTA